MPEFIPGIQLNEAYYWEAVRPILDQSFPGLSHSAALIGYGSDVLGYDTPTSRDHMWGPRLVLFFSPADFETRRLAIDQALRLNLPVRFRGYSTSFGKADPNDNGVRTVQQIDHGPVNHLIFFHTLESFWQQELGISPFSDLLPADWLTFSTQQLLSVTAGNVFYDDLGLEETRRRFAYYPNEVWLYLLAAQWDLISQQEAFVGRTWQSGDELGSKLIAASQVERLMRLCFLMEKTYAPYSKWFGTAFQHLACAPRMSPLLENVLSAAAYPERESFLAQAYTLAAEMHNALGITPPLDPRTRTYSGWHALHDGVEHLEIDDPRNTRPHQVIFGGRFQSAIYQEIHDPQVLALLPNIGSVNQFLVESGSALESNGFCRVLKAVVTAQ